MGAFPSGQRGQTVNLLSLTSLVRIQLPPPTKKELLSTKSSFFVYPSHRLGISSPREVRCISSAPLGLYIITRQRASYLRLDDIQTFGLMIYRNKLRMIYTPSARLRGEGAPNPRTDSNRHTVGVGASTTRKTPYKRAVVGASPYHSKFIYKALDAKAFWTDFDYRIFSIVMHSHSLDSMWTKK